MSATPDSALANPEQFIAGLKRQLAECEIERDQALKQQTATAEVLQVINFSRGDLAPVFNAILERATRLCEADFGIFLTYDSERFHTVALHNVPEPYAQFMKQNPPQPGPESAIGRILRGERVVRIDDVTQDRAFFLGDPRRRAIAELGRARSYVAIGLHQGDKLLGTLAAYRQEVRPFTDKQIDLLQNFAVQAAIAMENAGLLTATRDALEQQSAAAEVLQIIKSSAGNLSPVLEAILDKALRVCEADFGTLWSYDGEKMHAAAVRGAPPHYLEFLNKDPHRPSRIAHQGLLSGEQVAHIADITTTDAYRDGDRLPRAVADLGGVRTLLAAPLKTDTRLIGILSIYRQQVRPFSGRQIALLRNFADQAVIAMENARVVVDLRERTEELTQREAALRASEERYALAMRGINEGVYEWDVATGEMYYSPRVCDLIGLRASELRTMTDWTGRIHPDDRAGYRKAILAHFKGETDRLVAEYRYRHADGSWHWARQHGIALRNASGRAYRVVGSTGDISDRKAAEHALHEALEQQTATAEVLQVINSSPDDLTPVFDAMLEKALRLCEAAYGNLLVFDGRLFRFASVQGDRDLVERMRRREPFAPMPGTALSRIVEGEDGAHIADLFKSYEYDSVPQFRELVDIGGYRSLFEFALRKDKTLLGVIAIFRREARPFTDKQIALLRNFAAQAVIAMENARLLTETREALEQQTATAEVLQVINSSPGDLAPVFDAMLEKALALCDASFGQLVTFDGVHFRAAAWRRYEPGSTPTTPAPGMALYDLVDGAPVVHITDITSDDVYLSGNAVRRRLADEYGARTALWVALRKEAALLGAFVIYRTEVRPFSDKQIALLQNFSAQAVIAIENGRLIDEIRQRQAELRVTFDNMGDGVVMFDEELQLAAWNRNFQEMLDLPDAVLASRPSYAEYLCILAERGEFGSDDIEGELQRRLAETDQDLRLGRTRPDGRVIEVRRNAVPGGGFVLIYSDITERKQAEARLREARDTAEAALRGLEAAQANLIHAEKMASLGQLTAGIAHEIKNPLNFVNNFAGLSVELLDELKDAAAPAVAALDDDERAEIDELVATLSGNLDKIAEHGRRADGIVTSMLAHSRGGGGERRQVDLNALVDEALNLAYHGARARDQNFDIVIERDFDPAARPVELVPQDMTRVLLNLIGNGFYAASEKCRAANNGTRPKLKVRTRDLGEAAEIRVRDNGMGIPTEIREKLFQPFFTTKPTGEGTGLGLSISWDIVTQQHGGTIEVDSRPGEFTEFTVRLPRSFSAVPKEKSAVL